MNILRDRVLREHIEHLRGILALLGVIAETRFDGSADIAESDIAHAQRVVARAYAVLERLQHLRSGR